jgi:hypothetical protein
VNNMMLFIGVMAMSEGRSSPSSSVWTRRRSGTSRASRPATPGRCAPGTPCRAFSRSAANNNFDPTFSVDLARKDCGLAVQAGDDRRAPARRALALAQLDELIAEGLGGKDCARREARLSRRHCAATTPRSTALSKEPAKAPRSTPHDHAHRDPHVIGGDRVKPTDARVRLQPRDRRPDRRRRPGIRRRRPRGAACRADAQRWRETGLGKRQQVMFRLREIVSSRAEELAASSPPSTARPCPAARRGRAGLENVEFCTSLMHHLKGEYSEQVASGVDVHQVRQPIGVVACITPFNFPAMVPLWMVTTAIAAGNAVILKPSERDPSAANWIAEAFAEAGLPAGILNVVHGDKEAVDAILDDPLIRAVSFVGSTPIAKYIYARGRERQARAGARRREEPHDRHARRRPRSAADAAISAGYGSAGSAAWRSPSSSPSARST